MTGKPRRAGARWRLLVHDVVGRRYGDAHHIASDRRFGGGLGQDTSVEVDGRLYWSRHTELPGTEFDELVVGRWLHVEQMDSGVWWMNIGGVTVWIRADRDGRPTRVDVYGPGDYADPVEGVTYECAWSAPEPSTKEGT